MRRKALLKSLTLFSNEIRKRSRMKNPFLDFKNIPVPNKAIPLAQIVRNNRQVMEELLAAYQCLDRDIVKELCRLFTHRLRYTMYKSMLSSKELPKFWASTLASAGTVYESSLRLIRAIQYAPHDIEELCAFTGLAKEADVEQSVPMGLYISALINGLQEHHFELNLHNHPRKLHFLGFRLEEGKRLSVDGDLGHFTGAGLLGGYLNINGSTGSWCGADMTSGRIRITGDALLKTGEQMKGGQIQVNGRIREIAKYRSGGEIHSRSEDHVAGDQ